MSQKSRKIPIQTRRDMCISDTEQELVEKTSKFYLSENSDNTNLLKTKDFLKNRSFRKALSLEELDINNKICIGYYLDICLKKRKNYVKLLVFQLKVEFFKK